MKTFVEPAEPAAAVARAAAARPAAATEQRFAALTAELLAAHAERDNFAHTIVHDLRGPLMHIGGFADLLSSHSGAQLDEQGRQYLQTILDSAGQLERMLAEVVALSKLRRVETEHLRASARTGLTASPITPADSKTTSSTSSLPSPIAIQGLTRLTEKPAPLPTGEALRILLVEDSPPDVALITHMLGTSGRDISLVHVETREAFETELTSRPPHLILSDYSLPTFDGCKALEIAKQLTPQVPFIFVTGTLGEEVVIDMLKLGATDYVLKNRLTRLTPAVSRALSESEQRRQRDLAEEKFRRSHDQLRALTGHLQFVREEERTRIAREVHDELGQALTGLKLDLAWLTGKLPATRSLRAKIKAMSANIDETIHAVRRIATELRPGVLDSLGLAAAIEWQAAEFQERTGIRCEMKIEVTETLWEQNFSTVCFRVFQETLTNIIRHANATRVEVRLAQDEHALILTVRDNGRGITEKEIAEAKSIGLIGMKERAAQVDGKIIFAGMPGEGTTVTLRVPLPAVAAIGAGAA